MTYFQFLGAENVVIKIELCYLSHFSVHLCYILRLCGFNVMPTDSNYYN